MAKVIIFGTGDYAEQAHYYLSTDSPHEVVAFCLTRDWLKADSYLGKPLIAFEDVETLYPPSDFEMFLPMSGRKMNVLRQQFYNQAKDKNYRLISYVSSRALINDNEIGENCFILENTNIQPFVEIGDDNIIWCSSHIGHHSKLESHIFISSHVTICGHCNIFDNCYLSAQTLLSPYVTLAKGTLAGHRSYIKEDTETWGIYTGHPATKRETPSNEFDFL